jgi:hypothetical protein
VANYYYYGYVPIIACIYATVNLLSESAFCDVLHIEFNKQFFSNIKIVHRRKKPFNRQNKPHRKSLRVFSQLPFLESTIVDYIFTEESGSVVISEIPIELLWPVQPSEPVFLHHQLHRSQLTSRWNVEHIYQFLLFYSQ